MRKRQALTLQGRTPLISHPVFSPPTAPNTWTIRTAWPFDGIGTGGRALWGCWSATRSRFLVLGFSFSGTIPTGDPIAVSDDNGETWESRPLSFPVTNPYYFAVARSDSLDRTLIGGQENIGATAAYMAYSDDGGDTWTNNPVVITGTYPSYYPYPSDIFSLEWIEEQSQFILGCSNLATSPDGLTWTNRPLGSAFHIAGGVVYGIAYSPVNDRIAITSGSRIYTSDDAGVTWTLQTTPFDGAQITFIEWCPSISKFMAGCNNGGYTRSIMFSSEGITWIEPSNIVNDPGYHGSGTVYQTFNGLDIGDQILVTSPFTISGLNIKASGDGGNTWAPSPNDGENVLSFVLGDGVVLALGQIVPIMSSPIPVGA